MSKIENPSQNRLLLLFSLGDKQLLLAGVRDVLDPFFLPNMLLFVYYVLKNNASTDMTVVQALSLSLSRERERASWRLELVTKRFLGLGFTRNVSNQSLSKRVTQKGTYE